MLAEKLKVRSLVKKRKPVFKRRQAIRQFSKLKKSGWRAPKGMGNKQRRGRKGQPIKPTCGFGSPKEVRGLNSKGLKEELVYNVSDLNKISKESVAVIGSTVGKRKKLSILKEAKKKKINVLNVKDLDNEIKKLEKNNVKKDSNKASKKKEENKSKEVEK